ncbi:hypothetical protein [Brucella intermedia]|uniref:hypothetical protein n=1 Tax=Brucella intermedia TaxID=94625 RepID=UPI00046A51FB|nr:hypothetical protein [Brucella intermedia]
MSLEYISNHYRVPAKEGVRVRYTGGKTPRYGTITGAQGAHLLVQLDGQMNERPYHPTWEIAYLGEKP